MAILRKVFTCGALVALLVSALIGAFVAGVPTKFGFYRAVAGVMPALIGFAPAFMRAVDWQVTYGEIAQISLEGQTAVVTGANSGLGYWTSLHLARQGANVFMCCRTPAKCDKAAESIRANLTNAGSVMTVRMDTSSLKSVKEAAAEIKSLTGSLDMLVLNAGIGFVDHALSEDGFESVLATNQIGHHLLFKLLKPLMASGGKTGAARVVSVSSAANFETYAWGVALDRATMNSKTAFNEDHAYGQAKLASVLFAQEVSRRASIAGEPIFANAVNPGAVDTNMWEVFVEQIKVNTASVPVVSDLLIGLLNKLRREFLWAGEDGALTQIYLVASPMIKEKQIRGRYFHPQMAEVLPNRVHAANFSLQTQFYGFCDALVTGFDS